MNIFSNQDKSFFCNGQKVCVLVEFVNLFSTFGNVYTDVELLKTSIVCCSHKSTYYWVEILPWIDSFSRDNMFNIIVLSKQKCKCTHINSLHSLLDCYKNMTCLLWTIYSWQGFNTLVCPLMLKTNYRCVQSQNICVKCVETFHKFTQYTHFLFVTKNDFSWLKQSIHGMVSTY